MPAALLFDETCLLHRTGEGHPERPSRLESIRSQLKKDGLFEGAPRIEPRVATDAELCLIHTPPYVATAIAEIETGVDVLSTGDTHVGGPESLQAARHASVEMVSSAGRAGAESVHHERLRRQTT